MYGISDRGFEGYTQTDRHKSIDSNFRVFLSCQCGSYLMVLKETGTRYAIYRGIGIRRSYLCCQRSVRPIIGEVYQPLTKPVRLYSDSESVIALTKDGYCHARTKHVDIPYHFATRASVPKKRPSESRMPNHIAVMCRPPGSSVQPKHAHKLPQINMC